MSMRFLLVPVGVALALALVVFGLTYFTEYQHLQAHQPGNNPPIVGDVTSYPPEAAWMEALPAGVLTFFLAVPLVAFLRRLW